MKPKLSIIVPIYNVEYYLENCINSILNQTFKEFELILVNDGSPDNSIEICNKYKKKDDRIKVIDKENGGVSSARNAGIDIALGEYIAFVDPDDDIEINMYEELMNRAIKSNVDIVICSLNYINLIDKNVRQQIVWSNNENIIEKKEINNKIMYDILNFREGYGIYTSVNKVYKRELFYNNDIRFEVNRNHGEDARLNLILLTKVNSIYFTNKPLYNYYIRKRESLTTVVRDNMYKYILDNKNFHDYLCNLYGYQHLMDKGRKNYLNNIFQYMNSISISRFKLRKKVKILNQIMNDDTFKNNIASYEYSYRYYKLLKLACRYRLSLIYIFLIKLLAFKEKLDSIKNKLNRSLEV